MLNAKETGFNGEFELTQFKLMGSTALCPSSNGDWGRVLNSVSLIANWRLSQETAIKIAINPLLASVPETACRKDNQIF